MFPQFWFVSGRRLTAATVTTTACCSTRACAAGLRCWVRRDLGSSYSETSTARTERSTTASRTLLVLYTCCIEFLYINYGTFLFFIIYEWWKLYFKHLSIYWNIIVIYIFDHNLIKKKKKVKNNVSCKHLVLLYRIHAPLIIGYIYYDNVYPIIYFTLLAVVRKPADRPAVVASLNRDLARIQEWCHHWCMMPNPNKTCGSSH